MKEEEPPVGEAASEFFLLVDKPAHRAVATATITPIEMAPLGPEIAGHRVGAG